MRTANWHIAHASAMKSLLSLLAIATTLQSIAATPQAKPFDRWKRQRGATNTTRIDLGYQIYEGTSNSTTGLNVYKGYYFTNLSSAVLTHPSIRYAAPPLGPLRWQAPQSPDVNRTSVASADELGPACPQSSRAMPGAKTSGGRMFLPTINPKLTLHFRVQ